ncbi:MAG TPA: pyridoxal phosphate-dependent aminotransferase [Stellaceae bacterium]|nr:pyridoxal phosphate-dependent aminotransferase [Stellaceae bacterium]
MSDKSAVSKPAAIPGRPHGVRLAITALPMSKIGEVSAPNFGDPDIVPLWFGEGDLPTPDFICDAATAAMKRGETFYTFKRGIPELRQAIATYLTGLHAKPVASENVVVTSSGMSAIMLTMEALIDPGDSVIVLHPVWPNINSTIGIMGGVARPVSLAAAKDGGWKLDLQRVIDACDATTRAIYVNSPGNPTGWMMTREDARALLEFARKRGLWLLSDEVYSRIVYGRRVAPSFHDLAEPGDRVVVLQSFSKAWAMTGWRLGWMVAPPEMLTVMDKLIEYNFSGSPTFLQHAAVTAIQEGEPLVSEIVERCHIGRDLFVQGLARFPRVTVKSPEGSFYAFARVDGCTDSFKLARQIITGAKVGVAPGIAFGDAGEGYLRFCFASSKELLGEALDRLAKTKVLS